MKRAVGRREMAKRECAFRLKEKKVRLVARIRRTRRGRCRIRGKIWRVWNDLFRGGGRKVLVGGGGESIGGMRISSLYVPMLIDIQ